MLLLEYTLARDGAQFTPNTHRTGSDPAVRLKDASLTLIENEQYYSIIYYFVI